MDGPIPEMGDLHPQAYVQSLGMKVSEFYGNMMASLVAMKVDNLPDNLPKFVKVLDDWPEWALTEIEIRRTTRPELLKNYYP